MNERLRAILRVVQPNVLHLHSLLNLSFDLPALAADARIPAVGTLHDYTLACASGGQRVHRADAHRCDVIDTQRCARCFSESPFHAQLTFGRLAPTRGTAGSLRHLVGGALRQFPRAAALVARRVQHAAGPAISQIGRAHV